MSYRTALAPVPLAMDANDSSPPLRCPACTRHMQRTYVVRAWVNVDYCTDHGMWLDGGELERIAHRPDPPPDTRSEPQPTATITGFMVLEVFATLAASLLDLFL